MSALGRLLELCQRLAEENRSLRQSQEQLSTERSNLLAKNEQAILFLNRRGYATHMFCPKCGYVAMCPNCSVTLTYHRAARRMQTDAERRLWFALRDDRFAGYKFPASAPDRGVRRQIRLH